MAESSLVCGSDLIHYHLDKIGLNLRRVKYSRNSPVEHEFSSYLMNLVMTSSSKFLIFSSLATHLYVIPLWPQISNRPLFFDFWRISLSRANMSRRHLWKTLEERKDRRKQHFVIPHSVLSPSHSHSEEPCGTPLPSPPIFLSHSLVPFLALSLPSPHNTLLTNLNIYTSIISCVKHFYLLYFLLNLLG